MTNQEDGEIEINVDTDEDNLINEGLLEDLVEGEAVDTPNQEQNEYYDEDLGYDETDDDDEVDHDVFNDVDEL